MNNILLCPGPLDVNSIQTSVTSGKCGANSIFIGTTRNNFNNKQVISLEYEAYEPMALKQIQTICADIRIRWPETEHIAIHHRLGLVPVKEASVVIAISAPHRQTSLQAVEFAINELKGRVPIWKKEIYADHDAEWKENRESKKLSTYKDKLCIIKDKDKDLLPNNYVQTTANEEDIQPKKREQNNADNSFDFIYQKRDKAAMEGLSDDNKMPVACASVQNILKRGSNGQKVPCINNSSTFQTSASTNYSPETLYHFMTPQYENSLNFQNLRSRERMNRLCASFEERLNDAENYLKVAKKKIASSMYARLRDV